MRILPRNLKGRIYLALILVGGLPLLLGTALLLQNAEQRLEDAAMVQLDRIARERAFLVNHWLESTQAAAAALVSSPNLVDCLRSASCRDLEAHPLAGVDALLLFDSTARKVGRTPNATPDPLASEELTKLIKEVSTTGRARIAANVPLAVPHYASLILVPVRQQERGVLVLQLSRKYFAELMGGRLDGQDSSTGSGRTVQMTVGWREGAVMYRPQPNHPEQFSAMTDAALHKGMPEAAGIGRAIGADGRPVLAAWQPLGKTGLGLVAQMPLANALSDIYQLRRVTMGLLLAITALALTLGWLFARRLDKPLTELTDFCHQLPRNLSLRTERVGDDEFGRLGRTFNEMAQALEQAQQGLLELKQTLQMRVAERNADLMDILRLMSQVESIAGFGSWERYADGRLYWSKGVFRLLGLAPPHAIGDAHLGRLVTDGEAALLVKGHAHCVAGTTAYVLEHHVTLANGEVRWLLEHGLCEKDENDRLLRTYGTLQDVTAIAQERLQRTAAEDNGLNIVAHATEGIVVVEPASRNIVYMNEAAFRLFGRSSEQCIGHAFFMLFPFRAWPQLEEQWLRLEQESNLIVASLLCQRQDGSVFDADLSLFQLMYGGAQCYAGFFRDISYRSDLQSAKERADKAEEDALLLMIQLTAQQAVERSDLILSSLSDGVIGLSQVGRITFSNDAATSLLEMSQHQLHGRLLSEVIFHFDGEGQPIPPDSDPLFSFQNGEERIFSNEEWFAKADGVRFAVEYSGQPSLQGNEDLAGVLVFRNIDRRRRNDESLRQMSQAVEHSGSSVIISNKQGELVYVNPKFCEVSGYASAEVIGRNPRFLKSGTTPPELYHDMWSTILAGREWRGEILNRRKDASLWWESISITALKNRRGEITHFVSVREDITRQKALEARLHLAKSAAEAAANAKGAFLANISHEIRTPMNAILGFARLAMRGNLPGTTRDQLVKMQTAADGLLEILNDVLDFSKIESGNMAVEHIEFTLESVLTRFTDLVQLRLDDKPVKLTVHVAPEVPRFLVGDPLRLGQILTNLGTNAAKFTAAGDIRLFVQGVPHDGAIDLTCRVEDTGIGMTEEQISRLFTPFHQADTSTTRKFGGTGLGLAICRQLAGLMGGEVGVSSQPNQGTTFTLKVRLGVGVGATTTISSTQSRRLLLVDDDLQSRVMVRQIAAELGWDVTTATRADEALQELQEAHEHQEPYAVILLDWVMPDVDGIECVERIRRSFPQTAQPKPVLVTGFGLSELTAEMKRHQLDCPVLTKPVTIHELANILQSVPTIETTADAIVSYRDQTILVVDDYPFNQEIILAYLTPTGARILQANHGLEALEILERETVDLVFMDCQMPVMDGYETTRRIRQNPAWQRLPVVALTANATAGQREVVLAAGMNDYLTKPMSPEQLMAILAGYLRKSTSDSTTTPPPPPASPPANVDFPDIPGMDLETALKRAMNRPELLHKYLKMFCRSQVGFAQAFHQSWDAGDQVTAQRLAHTLKSGAASVGLMKLSEQAAALESACREQSDAEVVLALAKAACGELAKVLEKLA